MHTLPKQALCLILLSAMSFACRKSSGPSLTSPPAPTNVYVLGFTGDSLVYWKNGQAVLLAADSPYTAAASIFVSGNNVYVDGSSSEGGLSETAKYWVNGLATTLPDTTGAAFSNSIFVAGTDVYAAGWIFYPTPLTVPYTSDTAQYPTAGSVAVYWKNGVPTPLPTQYYVGDYRNYGSHVYSGYTSGISVAGSDVYVSGGDHQYTPGDTSSYRFALYWKDGVAVNLDNGLVDSTPTGLSFPGTSGIFVSGNDVYVSGFEATAYPSLTWQALYWKNGVVTNLTPGSINAAAYSIFVNGQDVYVTGYQYIDNVSRATYWKNGVANVIGNTQGPSSSTGIFVNGNDVYVAGSETVGGTVYATWWKNGAATHLGTGGVAYAIAVE